jgi:hypothetical protein
MNKLIAFGDSFTWGSELQDEVDANSEKCSQYTWPALLAKEHNLNYICLARPGASNQTIMRTLLDNIANLDKDDIVILNWTWINRWDFYNLQEEKWSTVRPASNEATEFDKLYYKYFQSELWDKLETLKSMYLANSILNSYGIKFVQTSIDDLVFNTEYHAPDYILALQNSLNNDILYFGNKGFYAWAKDNNFPMSKGVGHPLEKAHKEAYEHANKKFTQS